MKDFIIRKADTRGYADHGWLKARHTFSFAGYYQEDRVHFGALRVLNDDIVSGGMGFGMHPHENMEIITIPLEGELVHKDTRMGNASVIRKGDIQVMSAGLGVQHSERNSQADKPVKLLQIWVFPNTHNVQPRYDQITVDPSDLKNNLHLIVSLFEAQKGVWIYQNAWFFWDILT